MTQQLGRTQLRVPATIRDRRRDLGRRRLLRVHLAADIVRRPDLNAAESEN